MVKKAEDFVRKFVTLPDGTKIPALGQGTWMMGERADTHDHEAAILREGIEHGLTLIDTAELYANGNAERVVARAIQGRRDEIFLVSKITPQNASAAGVARHCEASLKRLGTDRLDLYLLHWPGPHPLAETIEAFERLKAGQKIRHWGVSNFDAPEMAALPRRASCVTDQILYNPEARGVEFDLLPWARAQKMPVMAYSPLGQAGRLLRSPALRQVAARHEATPAQVALAWSLRDGNTISIPKSATRAHLLENLAATRLQLSPEDLLEIDRIHPRPTRKQALEMI